MSKIELTHIDKYYGKNHVLKDLNLTIEDGDFMTLLGPSGCGKTTTLRVVSGLEKPQSGIILMDGKEIVNAAEASFAPPSKRNLNLVFQSYALWPHMTVFDNVAFGLRIRKENSETIAKKVASAWTVCRSVSLPNAIPPSCPAASSSVWPSPAPLFPSPDCFCWTNPCPIWTPSSAWICAPS